MICVNTPTKFNRYVDKRKKSAVSVIIYTYMLSR